MAEIFGDEHLEGICTQISEVRAAQSESARHIPAPPDRIAALRKNMLKLGLDGFLVPLSDEHQGEFIATRSQRLAWLTGFGGSAGIAIVMADNAAIFVDGRYTLQVNEQVDTNVFVPQHLAETPPDKWLQNTAQLGGKIGFDPWLHTPTGINKFYEACAAVGAELIPVSENQVDAVWLDQPPRPLGPVFAHPESFAGQTSPEKRRLIIDCLVATGTDVAVITAPESIAWLLNIRGCDVSNSPLALSYAVIEATGYVDWYIDPRKVLNPTQQALDKHVKVIPPDRFEERLTAIGRAGQTVRIDTLTVPEAVRLCLAAAGADIIMDTDPCRLLKAKKNRTEISGMRDAHIRDGVALTSFLAWLSAEAPKGNVSEISAATKLLEFRATGEYFRGLSFETISGSGPNGAIVHYRVTTDTDRNLQPGDLYLVDSGAQYLDGTTDVTRTIFIKGTDNVPEEVREHFTRVLKGHIAIANAKFPVGTNGGQIDAIARLALWEIGLDYDHGTGHGVGSYLCVHEGPQRISKMSDRVSLEPGMVLSNEPGYYKEGAYGIRIENLVVVKEVDELDADTERNMMCFETITLAPIDRTLIYVNLLSDDERKWLNDYHVQVRDTLSPLVTADVRAWLKDVTGPI